MITLLRRFVVLAAFAFWQGGFTFYAAIVVPIGTEVLGSPRDQGAITQRVTVQLNLAGGIALVLFALDLVLDRDPAKWRWALRWLAWGGMAVTLGLLVWLHPRMIDLLEAESWRTFRGHHRWYLWLSTIQWAFGVCFLLLTVWAWRITNSVRGERA